MKIIPPIVLSTLAPRFGADPGALVFLGGGQDFSDGTVFTFRCQAGRRVLKILGPFPAGDGALEAAEARVEGAAILADAGSCIVRPLPMAGGRRLEIAEADGQVFLAYAYPFVAGRRPAADDPVLQDRRYHRALGAAVGRLHATWERVPEALAADGTSDRMPLLGGWRQEWELFAAWCRDDEVGRAWERLRDALARLPIDKRAYGFVHNDVHPGNALFDPASAAGGREPDLALIDFDVANEQFFLADAASAIYGLAAIEAGGLETPRGPAEESLAAAARDFWAGYRRHREPGRDWVELLPLFLQYRRCLLFMPFQELTAADPDWRRRWKRRIAEQDSRLLG